MRVFDDEGMLTAAGDAELHRFDHGPDDDDEDDGDDAARRPSEPAPANIFDDLDVVMALSVVGE